MSNGAKSILLLVAALALTTVGLVPATGGATSAASPAEQAKAAAVQSILARLQVAGQARVIVGLEVPFVPEGDLPSQALRDEQRSRIAQAQDALLAQLDQLPASVIRRLKTIPAVVMQVDEAGLQALAANAAVVSILEDIAVPPDLGDSVPLIGGDDVWALGYTGAGQAVAILDTGVDKTHEFLTGRVIAEACFSTTDALNGSITVCPNGLDEQTGTGAGVNCSLSVDGCDHGTHVAGIAAGSGTSLWGVAKGASIVAIQVFSRFDDPSDCPYGAPCAMSWTSDQMFALDWLFDQTGSITIASANLSLGGGLYSSYCDTPYAAYKTLLDNLISVGVATSIAAGNSSSSTGVSAPSCISSAVTVGATTKSDAVASYSNSDDTLDFWAPGSSIYSSVPGNLYQSWSGTSMAAPHVAGAWALLKSAAPGATVAEILSALTATGVPITDSRNGVTKPRIQVDAALASLVPVTSNPPTIGTHRSNVYYLRNSNSTGYADLKIVYGLVGDLPIAGDWNDDDIDTIGGFRNGVFGLRNTNTSGYADITFGYGVTGDLPIVGDWDNDGVDTVGVFRSGVFYLRNSNTTGYADLTFNFGLAGDLPIAGDWNHDGVDTVGVFRNGVIYLRNSNAAGSPDITFKYGVAGDLPIAGDWDADGFDTVGVFRNGVVYLRNSNTTGYADVRFVYGIAGDKPLVGDWDGLP